MKEIKRCSFQHGFHQRTTYAVGVIATFLLAVCMEMPVASAAPADHFVTTWKTEYPGTSGSTSITVPMIGGPYDVDWDNDGVFDETSLSGSVTHNFGVAGTYTIRIHGTYDAIRFSDGGDKEKIVSLDQWGTNTWTSMREAFSGARYLTIPATDNPDFSVVTDMSGMFYGAASADPDTSGWDTSAVTDMSGMFHNATSANPDTSGWDTSSVTDMSEMFYRVFYTDPDTSGWDTSAVTDMSWMFYQALSANPDTSGWDTAAVTNMAHMFQGAKSANPDTSSWDTSAVTDMVGMFNLAILANPDTSGWDTSAVTNMALMFNQATSANPSTSGWDTSSVTYMYGMFQNAQSANPDTSGWDTSAVTSMAWMFSATSANPDTSGWDTSAVRDMSAMFQAAKSANPDTSGWNTASVTSMFRMFWEATVANPDTSGWNTSAVSNMEEMFENAISFDRDIGSWNVTTLKIATDMFAGVKLSTTNYDSLLVGWNAQSLQPGVIFSGGRSTYCSAAAIAARANMIASDLWVITDWGQSCPPETCNVNMIAVTTEDSAASYEACENLILGPDLILAEEANVSANSGLDIKFRVGFLVETGATLNANVCGQSLCETSASPMPYGCHSCVDQICAEDSTCCTVEFDETCLDMVDTVCSLVCD